MATEDDNRDDTETMLLALDQISQTIDVMTSVVGRLRHQLKQQAADTGKTVIEHHPDRTLH